MNFHRDTFILYIIYQAYNALSHTTQWENFVSISHGVIKQNCTHDLFLTVITRYTTSRRAVQPLDTLSNYIHSWPN